MTAVRSVGSTAPGADCSSHTDLLVWLIACTSQDSNPAALRHLIYSQASVQPLTTYVEPGTGFEPVSVALQATASPLGQPGILDLIASDERESNSRHLLGRKTFYH